MTAQAVGASSLPGGPPKDVPPVTLLTRLMEMPRPTALVDYPRKDPATGELIPQKVALVILTSAEQQKARAAAEKYALDMLSGNPDGVPFKQVVDAVGGRSLGYEELYRNELAIETICLACREPGNVKSFVFPNSQIARAYTTTDEITVLFMAYCDHQAESGPIVSSMTVPVMEAWIRRIQEGMSRLPLARVSLDGLKDLVMHLVSTRATSPTDSGSSGSPPSERSQSTSTSLPDESERPEPLRRDD